MRFRLLSFLALGALASAHISSTSAQLGRRAASTCDSTIVSQYYAPWGDIDPTRLLVDGNSFVVYFAFETTSNGVIALPAGATVDSVRQFVSAVHAKGKKAAFAIGGWGASKYFSKSLSTTKGRAKIIQSIVSSMKFFEWDVVDIDWEYPGKQGIGDNTVSSNDSVYLLRFLRDLRAALAPGKFITASFPASGITGPDGSPVKDMRPYADYLDYVTIMSFDFYGNSWSKTTGPNAALYTCREGIASVDAAVNYWLSTGFPSCKLLMGVATYSHLFKTYNTYLHTTVFEGARTQAFQPVAASQPADPSYSLPKLMSLGWLDSTGTKGGAGFVRYWDNCTQTPFLFNKAGNKKLWVTYDDAESTAIKAQYAMTRGLGGVIFYDSAGLTRPVLSGVLDRLSPAARGTRRLAKRALDDEMEEEDMPAPVAHVEPPFPEPEDLDLFEESATDEEEENVVYPN